MVSLGSIILVAVLDAGNALRGLELLERAQSGLLSQSEAARYEQTALFIAVTYLLVFAATGIAFLAWLSRTVDNVPALGAGTPRTTPRWAIAWWFVPFANLWMPLRVVLDVNRRLSQAGRRGTTLIVIWWMAWVINLLISFVALRLPTDTIEQLGMSFVLDIIIDVLDVVGAVLAIAVIRQVQNRATHRAALSSAGRA